MADKLYIDTLTENQINKIEFRLRPGESSDAGFLGPNESLKQVIYEDDATLKRLGVTHKQVADKLESLVKNQQVNNEYKVEIDRTRGMQEDPFQEQWAPGTYPNLEITITNPVGESISFGGPIIGLIRDYQFFEGKGTPYRLDPETAVKVLKLK